MAIAIYPGSFDPVTLGHLDIIKRVSLHFDKLVVCVMVNSTKRGLFQHSERVDMLRRVTRDIPNVEIDCSNILLSDYARQRGATAVVKGLREVSDFEKEFQMALINRKLNPELETFFLPARQNFTYLSSSIVKEMAAYQVDLTDFVPGEIVDEVAERMQQHLRQQEGR